mmetsp:Transcript_54875/g.141362  ORF Transcript_54875/g.141362 Transcript_54875/m.141362 type:complete len:273 (-) Transcript_54875:41-859(-)
MSDSVYRKTPLPVRLNLNDRNTREQLSNTPEDSSRGTLEGVGLAPATASASSREQSEKDSLDVMRKDLQAWLHTNGISGPPPSAEAEQRAMWMWIRAFHKEYGDDWFSRNMPRLHERFRPVFLEEMKAMKAAAAPSVVAPAAPASGTDLLDFDQPAVAAPAPPTAPAAGGSDLLSLDFSDAPAPAAPGAGAATSVATVQEPQLLDPLAAASAPALASMSPAPDAAGDALAAAFGGMSMTAAPPAPPAVPAAPPAGVGTGPQNAGGDLLDLMM